MRSAALKRASQRTAIMKYALLGLFAVLAIRAAHLTVIEGHGGQKVDYQVQTSMELPATRGLITDRNGVELALTIHAPSIYVMPQELRKDPAALKALAKALGIERGRLAGRLRDRKHFTFVARWVDEEVAERVSHLKLPGVGILREPKRAYPAGELAGSILGFANIDGEGVRGIEQQEDAWLKGTPVRTPVERDARGRLRSRQIIQPRAAMGGDVALTIDASMQAEAETALREAVEACGAIGGSVITLDPHTGEILALAEAPGFDPNLFRTTDYRRSRSRVFADILEPGSTFKAFLIATALDADVLSADELIDTGDGTIDVPGKRIRDHHPYGILDAEGILRVSSNVGTVIVAQRLGEQKYFDSLRRFGFGRKTGIGFPQEEKGLLRPWQRWQPVDHATIAFGQGVSVTAIQLANAMAVIAGDGQWKRPRLIAARRRPTGSWKPTRIEERRPVIRKQTAHDVLRMLESVVSAEGTARRAALAGVRVAGKTGTAQKFDREQKHYSQTRYTAWFMGVAPADDPKLVIVAMLDEPKGRAHGGGDVAAPLFARVAAGQLAELSIITHPEPIPAKRREPVMLARAEAPREKPAPRETPPAPTPMPQKALQSVPEDAPDAPRKVSNVEAAEEVPGSSIVTTTPRRAPIAVKERAAEIRPTERAPKARRPRPAGVTARATQAVLTPDFRGETVERALELAAREHLVIEVQGSGLAIEQHPRPGTILVGGRRQVRVTFSGAESRGVN